MRLQGRSIKKLLTACVAGALFATGPLSTAAVASQAEPDVAVAQSPLRLSETLINTPSTKVQTGDTSYVGKTIWPSPRLNRGYMLIDGMAGLNQGYHGLVAIDLDTYDEVGRAALPLPGYNGYEGRQPSAPNSGLPYAAAVDDEGGKVFVAYQPGLNTTFGSSGLVGSLGGSSHGRSLATAPQGQVCPTSDVNVNCFAGVHAIDGATMAVQGSFRYQQIRTDAASVVPRLLAMSYAPPAGDVGGKILLVVEEFVLETPGIGHPTKPRLVVGSALNYVVQMDATSGVQDWAVRLDACRGTREPRSDEGGPISMRPHAAAIFKDMRPGQQAVIVGCHSGSTQVGTVVGIPLTASGHPAPLPVGVTEPGSTAGPAPESAPDVAQLVTLAPPVRSFAGPDRVVEMIADPPSGRVLMRVVSGNPLAEVWWVFDAHAWQLAGTVGIGQTQGFHGSYAGLDTSSGRLYVLSGRAGTSDGGLYMADIRRMPLPQALVFPEFALLQKGGSLSLSILPTGAHDSARVLVRDSESINEINARWAIIEDALPVTVDTDFGDYTGRTQDLDEIEGVTQVAFDGAARGYGARVLLVGGADATTRVGPADPLGQVLGAQDNVVQQMQNADSTVMDTRGLRSGRLPVVSPCTAVNRDVIFGFVGPSGPAVVDAAGARAQSEPVVTDTGFNADSEQPLSRCLPVDWSSVWSTALFGRPPADEPRVSQALGRGTAECVVPGEQEKGAFGDPVLQGFSSGVECSQEGASGWAQVRAVDVEGLHVASASSSFRIYRDPQRGVVSRVESVVRGLAMPEHFRVDTVRALAESWANGRKQPVAAEDRDPSYNPNCDFERTAGSCFVRHVFGVSTSRYSCGPCGDEARLEDGLNRAMNGQGVFMLRDPDPNLARGAENGFIAGVSKPDNERFADLVLNNDLLQTVVPGLELIRYAAPNRFFGGGPRGRQIYQFAGVEVSSSYGISCLLVYDEATNTCAEPKGEPGAIQVSLSDTDGKPLAGGAFEVRADVDADGVLGLKDTLLPEGACVTAEDGVGTCKLENLQPGSYLVSQVAAPPGYAKSAEPFVVDLASGEQRTVAFTNVSNVSTIDLKVTDENGQPLSGATFAAYPDEDSDGKVAPDAKPAAECTTDSAGVCQMKVPAGSYVLVQTSAPGGLEGIEPVPFTFASGGQVASVTVVNYPPESPQAPEAAPSPVYTPPVDMAPPTEIVEDYTPVPDVPVIVEPPAVSVPERIGGTVTQVIRAPGDALRLLARDPKQAVAWTAALALFVLAAMAIRRRQAAIALIQQ